MSYTRIKYLRKQKKWSLRKLGLESKVSFAYIRELEEGKKTRPSLDIIERIANALEVTIFDLREN